MIIISLKLFGKGSKRSNFSKDLNSQKFQEYLLPDWPATELSFRQQEKSVCKSTDQNIEKIQSSL